MTPLKVGKLGKLGTIADKVADAWRTNSFTGETLVLMADGSKKPIKDIELGDEVMAADPVTGERGPRTVIDVIRHSGPHTMVAVRLADGTTIDATDHHPFWVASRGEWVDAIELRAGDVVTTADGRRITVAKIGLSEQNLTADNLTVNELHTYYAGADSVLVHNAGGMDGCSDAAHQDVLHLREEIAKEGTGGSRACRFVGRRPSRTTLTSSSIGRRSTWWKGEALAGTTRKRVSQSFSAVRLDDRLLDVV